MAQGFSTGMDPVELALLGPGHWQLIEYAGAVTVPQAPTVLDCLLIT